MKLKCQRCDLDFGDNLSHCPRCGKVASSDSQAQSPQALEDFENLPAPGVIAAKIVEDLESAFEQMRLIADDLGEPADDPA